MGNKETSGVGGNTTCVEVRCGDEIIIFDSGTGIVNLGRTLMKELPVKARLFYSHVHWDHIQGFPFFAPFYVKGNEFDIYGGTCLPKTIQEVLQQQMTPPCFPVKIDLFGATLRYHDISQGDVIEGKNMKVTLGNLYHPNGSFGYRVESENRSLVFATDNEHLEEKMNKNLLHLSQDVDVLIYDAQYTDDEYYGRNGQFSRKGWGHSTMREGIKIAKAANVDKLVLFHHDPSHPDEFVGRIEAESRKIFPRSIAAYEGLEIDLNDPDMPKSMFD
ncbi:MAG: MBL fold metallo-hydrolase [Nitrospinae bacterium CG11_big_fil_rev_8_21_14_0_20_56_8]|nr:MAG: MBL fold metallo-hydrolase [Nitrospinae bacterium CG11_big_fil_rev_8_21_14_0_20_56_8]